MLSRVLLVLLLLITAPSAFASPGILLTITEPTQGQWTFEWSGVETIAVAPGTPLSFSWIGDAETHGASITGYRFGWNVQDIEDPDDPGWMIPWRDDILTAPTQLFTQGTPTFVVLVKDDIGRVTNATIIITIDPTVSAKPTSWGQLKNDW